MNAGAVNCMLIPPPELFDGDDVSASPYISYPDTDRFVEAFSAEQACQVLSLRRHGGGAMHLPLSLYVHIPFCESQCYFCTKSQVITRRHEHGKTYLLYLRRELELKLAQLGTGHAVSQLYLGGGSPTFLGNDALAELMLFLREKFAFEADAELHIEVDPRSMDAQRLAFLVELGFNHLSLGVQDFDPQVQKALHRQQSAQDVGALVAAARHLKFTSIHVDLIYGLPKQTSASFEQTLAQVCTLKPDRILLDAYAHLPTRFKSQRKIDASELPAADVKSLMQVSGQMALQNAGYIHVGMDYFVLPQDALAVAKRQGRLHRSLLGYSTQPDSDLLGLGVSAISKWGGTYCQNAKTLEAYYDFLDQGCLPVARGLALSRDDLLRRAVIMALLCQGKLDFESIELSWLIGFKGYFAAELLELAGMREQGLVDVTDTDIEVTPMGWFFVRSVAMIFDRYHRADRARARFSRII